MMPFLVFYGICMTLVIFYHGLRQGVSVRANAIESAHWFLPWTTIIGTDAIKSALETNVHFMMIIFYLGIGYFSLWTIALKIIESTYWFIRHLAYKAHGYSKLYV